MTDTEIATIADQRIAAWIATGRCKRVLDLSNLQLEELPILPTTVRRLNLSNNKLWSLIGLPINICNLWLYNNPNIESLEGLPLRLRFLQLGAQAYVSDKIKIIKDLPDSIRTLYIYGLSITDIVNLPRDLRQLNIRDCDYLQTIHSFPQKLLSLSMDEVKYDGPHTLPPFPDSLRLIELIFVSELQEIPELPRELRSLHLCSTAIKVLPTLPSKLIKCSISGCHLDNDITEIPLHLPNLLYFYYSSNNARYSHIKPLKLDKLPITVDKYYYYKN
jgi:hypothetical protein